MTGEEQLMGLFGFKKSASGFSCPHCGAAVEASDRFCINCGKEIPASGGAAAGTAVPLTGGRACPKCGAAAGPDDAFCQECGQPLPPATTSVPTFSPNENNGVAFPPKDMVEPVLPPSYEAPVPPHGSLETDLNTDKDVISQWTGLKYNVDIVMCIDATGSMKPILDTVKNNALRFYDDLTAKMEEKDKHIDTLRVRVIAFRDYTYDGDEAMLATDFFELPADTARFRQLVSGIRAKGGGDKPEDGLEALAYAMRSDWTREGDRRRHIIAVWTDDGTHDLGFSAKAPNYPKAMAKDFDELTEWWGDAGQSGVMDANAKRLLVFAPEKPSWTTIESYWDNVVFFPSIAGQGLREVDYEAILSAICNSI